MITVTQSIKFLFIYTESERYVNQLIKCQVKPIIHCTKNHISQVLEYHGKLKNTK